jgi:molecular chaperone DnaK
LTKLKDAHKSQDLAQIDAALAEMNTAWTAASEEIYKAQAAGGGQPGADGNGQQGGPQGSQGSQGETVTDAEFEEVK